ncbi:NYN domain-containing protein [Raphanus sativus]|nr:NYN domain-containing protein [Raphanus sativus]
MLHTSDWNLPPRMQEQILRFHQETNSMAGILDKEGMPCADYVSAPVLVIWDIENVNVKANCRGERIKKVILEFLHSQGHVGDNITIHIIAAHEDRLHEDVRKSLEPNGIKFTHLNTYSKQAGDKAIIREIKRWTEENPAPGTVFLISGDKDFSLTVANLEQQKFNTIVAFERGSLSDRMKYVGYKLVEFKTLSQDMGPLESDSKEA